MQRIYVTAMCLTLLLLLIGCTSPASSIPSSTATAPETVTSPRAEEMWKKDWQGLVDMGKKEGMVTIASGISRAAWAPLEEAFRKRYGIHLEIVSGRGAELTAKLFMERRAGVYALDIASLGTTSSFNTLVPAGVLDPLEPALMLPDVLDPKVWLDGAIQWLDSEHRVVTFLAGVNVPIVVNPEIVKAEEMKSYRDLLDPKWKSKISMGDPTGGTGSKWFGVVGRKFMGWDYLRALTKQEPVIIRDARLQIDWLVHGKHPIAIAPKTEVVLDYRNIGIPIKSIMPREGVYSTIGGGVAAIINRAPHPNATKVFINWLLTKEAQSLYSKSYGRPSRRLDVPTEGLDPETIPQPRVEYYNGDSAEILLGETETLRLVKEILGGLVQ